MCVTGGPNVRPLRQPEPLTTVLKTSVNARTWAQKHLSPKGKGCIPSTNTNPQKKPPQNTGKFPPPNVMLIFRQSSAETGYFGICRLQNRVGASPTPPTSTGDGESSRRSRCIVLARFFLSVTPAQAGVSHARSFSQLRQFQPAQFFAFDLSLKLPKSH